MFPLKQCIQLEQDVRPALAGVLHVDPHLPVLLAPLVVVSVVLTPGEHAAQTKVEEYRTQQQPWSSDVTLLMIMFRLTDNTSLLSCVMTPACQAPASECH